MPGPYTIGDLIRVTANFIDINGLFVDPTLVLFKYKDPANVITHYSGLGSIVRDGQGIYHIDISVPLPGAYFYTFYATGTGQSAAESSFAVKHSHTG